MIAFVFDERVLVFSGCTFCITLLPRSHITARQILKPYWLGLPITIQGGCLGSLCCYSLFCCPTDKNLWNMDRAKEDKGEKVMIPSAYVRKQSATSSTIESGSSQTTSGAASSCQTRLKASPFLAESDRSRKRKKQGPYARCHHQVQSS